MTTYDLLFWVTRTLLVQHVDSTIHLQPQILVLGSTSIKWRDYITKLGRLTLIIIHYNIIKF